MSTLNRPASLSALISVLCLAGCGGGMGSPEASEGGVQQRELATVRVATVGTRNMARTLETTSKLESEREIAIVPRVGGVVLAIHAEEGDVVAQGAELATIDSTEQTLAVQDSEVAWSESKNALERLREAVREAEARGQRTQTALDQAGRDYERNQKLFAGEKVASALSQSALEASKLARDNAQSDRQDAELLLERSKLELKAGETAVERARITLEKARLALTWTHVTAPFAGVVARRSVRVGDAVGASTTVFVLTDIETLRCVFSRPQEELELFARVGQGQTDERLAIEATADAYPGRTFSGWIERVSPTIDAQSGQFRVTGRLEGVQEGGRVRLLPGMLVRLAIVTERHEDALVVPKRAIEREGERRYVLLVRDL
ncbi:MAG: efflux RND transporter periplasmic adaptor subunit, partial [Planctomycetota bacterium]